MLEEAEEEGANSYEDSSDEGVRSACLQACYLMTLYSCKYVG